MIMHYENCKSMIITSLYQSTSIIVCILCSSYLSQRRNHLLELLLVASEPRCIWWIQPLHVDVFGVSNPWSIWKDDWRFRCVL